MHLRLSTVRLFLVFFLAIFLVCQVQAAKPPAKPQPTPDPLLYRYAHGDQLPEKTVFLTFDDGPGEWTGAILDVLRDEGVKATFFVCARWGVAGFGDNPSSFQKHAAIMERMVDEGHAIGSHSSRHQNYANLKESQVLADLDENQAELDKVLGPQSPRLTLIRPPYGGPWFANGGTKARQRMTRILQKRGLPMLWTWEGDSGDSSDWTKGEWYSAGDKYIPTTLVYGVKVQRIQRQVLSVADGQGIVVLMHDIHPTNKEALPRIIRELRDRGYVFATMEDYVQWRWKKSSSDIVAAVNKPQTKGVPKKK